MIPCRRSSTACSDRRSGILAGAGQTRAPVFAFSPFSPAGRSAERSEAMRGPLVSSFQLPPSVLPDISPSRGEIGRTKPARPCLHLRPSSELTPIPCAWASFAAAGVGIKAPATRRSPPLRGRCPAGQRGADFLDFISFLFSPAGRSAERSEAMRGLGARRSASSGPAGHLLPAGEKRRLAA